MNQIVLIDGKNQLFRMHFSPALMPLSREDGHPTGALFGCLRYSLLSMASRLPEAAFVWVWDGQGATWRHRMMEDLPQIDAIQDTDASDSDEPDFLTASVKTSLDFMGFSKKKVQRRTRRPRKSGYKGNRVKAEGNEEKDRYPTDEKARALLQMPVLKFILASCGIQQFECPGLECDDLIAMLAEHIHDLDEDCEVIIFSGDKDYYQLLKRDTVHIIKGIQKGSILWVKPDEVEREYGVSIKQWSRFRALTGDPSDNIPHLWKVGKVTARKMLEDGLDPGTKDYKDLDKEVLEKYAKYFQPHGVEKMWPALYGNYKLVRLVHRIDDKLLSDDVKERLHIIFRGLKSLDDFSRSEDKKTSRAFREVEYLLGKYELNSILAEQERIWEIP